MTCDQFIRLDVVTAEGELVHASETENQELFWALRGGGGNFGIVVNFEVRLHAVGKVQSGWLYTLGTGPVVGVPAQVAATPVDAAPGDNLLGVYVCHHGPAGEARAALAPLMDIPVVGDCLEEKSYSEAQHELDWNNAYGRGWYMKSAHTRSLGDELIGLLMERAAKHRSETVGLSLTSLGGAIGDTAEDDASYGGRAAQWFMALEVAFTGQEDRERLVKWAGDTYEIVTPLFDLETSYVNFIRDTESSYLEKVFGKEKFRRLRQVKTTWDRDNFFAHNSNIPPLDPTRGGLG